ncbi:MAG TPA: hypothetical protein PKK23_11145 [Nitrospirales bacterium]|nr:hypothetical protein [Nitrospirales bacterium]
MVWVHLAPTQKVGSSRRIKVIVAPSERAQQQLGCLAETRPCHAPHQPHQGKFMELKKNAPAGVPSRGVQDNGEG